MVACRMNEEAAAGTHIPVLLDEVMTHLITDRNGCYVDATFGRGGHSQALLNHLGPTAKLLAIDKDLTAIAHARQVFSHDQRFIIYHGSFAELKKFLVADGKDGQV